MKLLRLPRFKNEHGVTALFVTLLLPFIFAFVGFAIDLGHLYVVRNELHKAADAGALAGARFLLKDDGTAINTGCNQIAYNAAVANLSEKQPVEVWNGDVQRGHWSFATRTFTPNDSTVMVPIWNVTFEELDTYNPDKPFINAVRVETRRETNQALSFFVRVFNPDFHGFTVRKSAVAYLGFAGKLEPGEADQPVGLCKQSLMVAGKYSCSIGRFIVDNADTGGWTNFTQPCETANAPSVRNLICANGNPIEIPLGVGTGATNGHMESAYNDFYNCWKTVDSNNDGIPDTDSNNDGIPDTPWQMTLPVFDCEDDKVGNCMNMVGAVELNIIWVQDQNDPDYSEVPYQMNGTPPAPDGTQTVGPWSSSTTDGATRWGEFADHFSLKMPDGITQAPYQQKCIYFLPDCKVHVPTGSTGGDNFGIRAKYPVLVE